MQHHLKQLGEEVSLWSNVSVYPHRLGGTEFRFGNAEIGHIHAGGIVDIPFPRSIRDALITEGLADEHRWVPNSGWITFRIRREQALKTSADPQKLFEQESERLHVNDRFKSLLEPFVPKTATAVLSEELSAQMPSV